MTPGQNLWLSENELNTALHRVGVGVSKENFPSQFESQYFKSIVRTDHVISLISKKCFNPILPGGGGGGGAKYARLLFSSTILKRLKVSS